LQYSDDNGTTFQASNIFSGLGAGSYNIVVKDANGCTSGATSVTITAPAALTAVCSNNNSALFYGYSGDQTSTITVTPSGGTAPYKVTITMNRPMLCNQVNDAGDESWVGGSGGTTINNSCPANPALATLAPSTTKTISSGSYSATVTLMADAVFTATITDANGCVTTCSTTIHAEDVRCFAGNSGVAKVAMCHKTGSNSNPCTSICVDPSAVQEHLNHGDFYGKCTSNCVAPPNSTIVTNPAAMGGLSNTIGNTATGTQELTAQVTPNPTETYFTLHVQSSSKATVIVKVFDITGRQVELLRGPSDSPFQFGQRLTGGIYIVQIHQGDLVKIIQVMKLN
jgi:hypothetical protein